MKKIKENLDLVSFLVIAATLILFVFALYTKEFLHDFLLEAAIFLVSLKLIISAYKQSVSAKRLESQLKKIDEKIDRLFKK